MKGLSRMEIANRAWLRTHTFSVMVNGERVHTFQGGGAYSEALREADYRRGCSPGAAVQVMDDFKGEVCG